MILKKIIPPVFLFFILIMTGCTKHYFEGFNAQSHFDYPNSNIKPLGFVRGESSVLKIGLTPFLTGSLKKDAINNALENKPGSDILINYTSSIDTTSILFIFNTLTYKVEGTAAEMEIGKQILKEFK